MYQDRVKYYVAPTDGKYHESGTLPQEPTSTYISQNWPRDVTIVAGSLKFPGLKDCEVSSKDYVELPFM